MLNNSNLNTNTNDAEIQKLKKIITILLSVSALLAVILITLGITKIINYARTAETSDSTPVFATLVSTEATFTEPTVYHSELLEATPLADSYWRPLPELPEDQVKVPDHFEVKGLYIGSGSALDKAIELCNNSELNTIVIDLKNEYGLPYMSKVPTANEIGYVWDAYDLDAVIEKCHANNIRVIGRIVSFNDQVAAQHFPPTKNKVKPYFGEEGQYPEKSEAVNRFLQEARIRIQDTYGVAVSADIFGIVLTSPNDAKIIGQDFETLGMTGIDSCCPMVYPSHYALGTMLGGHVFEYPDKQPYLMVYSVLHECQAIYKQPGFTAVRPYLQAFTASYIGKGNYMEYGYREINSQIKAIHDLGIQEYILWDPSCRYPSGSYDGDMSVETD